MHLERNREMGAGFEETVDPEFGVAFQTENLDLNDVHARLARERGVPLVISTDAHSIAALGNMQWGVQTARRAWVTPDDVLNTRTLDDMLPRLRRRRAAA